MSRLVSEELRKEEKCNKISMAYSGKLCLKIILSQSSDITQDG